VSDPGGQRGQVSCSSGGATPEWYVAHTQRHRERVAQGHLGRIGLGSYVPLVRHWPRPAVGNEIGPMFPGYVFVRASREHLHRVDRTPGVRALLVFDGEPARLEESAIVFLQAQEEPDGVILCARTVMGREVHITRGPLRGLVAIVESRLTARERVLVLLDLLQRQTRVEMPERWVRA
jgi:transcription antitermination factor NusG